MAIFVCTSSLPTTGAFSQNFGKLISELKLVSDNLLFSYIFKFSAQNHTTATHCMRQASHSACYNMPSAVQCSNGDSKVSTLLTCWHNSVPQQLITWLMHVRPQLGLKASAYTAKTSYLVKMTTSEQFQGSLKR